jgi:hypothetical protein
METRKHTPLANFTQVDKDAFFATIGPLDVHPTPISPWPYASEWKDQRTLRLVAWSQGTRYAVHPDIAPSPTK